MFLANLLRRNISRTASKAAIMGSAKETTEATIAGNKIVVFSKSYCPYCKKAKDLLDSYGATYEQLELDMRDDGADIQQYLAEKTGQRTVPNIFINQKQVGGCDDLFKLNAAGELKNLLKNLQADPLNPKL
ncbi:hypothetical protein HK100_000454 [Physocladia obscura]|uniref:Glutaredoxin domain-containing protein n=1 Tax=Physocladia obscura TaxID=109957 RepID=A0AAD5SY94_9FUNG|nr:hypothetical protein HK100_000454 [Physocladia obscura]